MVTSKHKQAIKETVKADLKRELIIPTTPLIPQVRWDEKVSPILEKVTTLLYNNELTYHEIDVIIGLIGMKVAENKLVPGLMDKIDTYIMTRMSELDFKKEQAHISYIQ